MAPPTGEKTTGKFGCPLYGAAFLSETLLAVGGGGGHGIKNKLMVVNFENGLLSPDPVFSLGTGSEVVQRLVLHPSGTTLVTAFIERLQLYAVHLPVAGGAAKALTGVAAKGDGEAKEETEVDGGRGDDQKEPLLAPFAPKTNGNVLSEAKETKCIVFSKDGTRLVVGSGEGTLLLLAWPALDKIADVKKAHKDSLTDADFSQDGKFLITTGNELAGAEGGAMVWDAKTGQKLSVLGGYGAAKGVQVRVRGVKFAVNVTDQFQHTAYLGANIGGVGQIIVFRKKEDSWVNIGTRKALKEPITSLSLAPTGKALGIGYADGGVAALIASSLAPLNRIPAAHMIFVTAVAFSPSGKVMASTSGDASLRCTVVATRKGRTARSAFIRFILMLVLNYLFWVIVLKVRPDVADALKKAQTNGWMLLKAKK